MQIANPIYDVVFKYLFKDNNLAKLLLSSIIGEEITTLEFSPEENIVAVEHRSLTVFRIDFAATIKTEAGFKKVLIEIQKAKFATDIMRFRKYLGQHYQNKENCYELREGKEVYQKPLPILSIYFLGYKLDHLENPIIQVKRNYYDAITKELIRGKEEFIESLTHDSFVIQIPYLTRRFKTDLEILLSVFDQSNATSDLHILNINENSYPEKYRPIIRRLQEAIAEPKVRKTMEIEDEVLEEMQNLERLIENKDKTLEENRKALVEKDKVIEEKDRIIKDLMNKLKG